MKRVCLLALGLLLLSACGRAEPAQVTIASTTAAETTRGSMAAQDIAWHVVRLSEAENERRKAEADAWIAEQKAWEPQSPKSGWQYVSWWRDDDGIFRIYAEEWDEETQGWADSFLALEGNGKKGVQMREPSFYNVLCRRHFIYEWVGHDGRSLGFGVYDTVERKEIPIDTDGHSMRMNIIGGPEFSMIDSGIGDDLEPEKTYSGPLHLMAFDCTGLHSGQPLRGVDLLEGFRGPDAMEANGSDLTAQYYIVPEKSQVRIYDLRAKKLLTVIPADTAGSDTAFYTGEDNAAYYAYHFYDAGCVVEIAIP